MEETPARRVTWRRVDRGGDWSETTRELGGVELSECGAAMTVRAGLRMWAVVAGAPAPSYWRGMTATPRGATVVYRELYWADCLACDVWPGRFMAAKRLAPRGRTHRDECLTCGRRADVEPPRVGTAAVAAAAALGRRGEAAAAYALRV